MSRSSRVLKHSDGSRGPGLGLPRQGTRRSRCGAIDDDEQRGRGAQPLAAHRVAATCGPPRRCASSTMRPGIACVAAPGGRHTALATRPIRVFQHPASAPAAVVSAVKLGGLVLLVTLVGGVSAGQAQTPLGLGRSASLAEIDGWGAIIGPDGEGLPPGRATATEGRDVYRRRCARCHGPSGNDGPDDRLVGGVGSLATDQARKTVGSYWPVATTLWDYVNRAMSVSRSARVAHRGRGLRGGRVRLVPERHHR